MTGEHVERLLKLIQSLQSGRARTAEEIAGLISVSQRTVFRDLNLLARAGLRYAFDQTSKRYSIDPTALLPPIALTHAETLSLLLLTRLGLRQPFVTEPSAAASAVLKIESMLPPAMRDECSPTVQGMEVRPDPASQPEAARDILSFIQAAFARRRKVRATYDSFYEGRAIEVVLHPYRLAYLHRGWYVLAMTEDTLDVRTYKLGRMRNVKLLSARYHVDPSFSLDNYLGNAWLMIRGDERHHVRLRFTPTVAGNVSEIRWHKTQRTFHQPDGSLIFEADIDGIGEISWWILGYGDQVEVLESPALRERIASRAKALCAIYDGSLALRCRGGTGGPDSHRT